MQPTECLGQQGTGLPGGEDIALNLAQRDRTFGRRTVGVADSVVRVFPSLVQQASRRLAMIFHQPVAIEVAVCLDPVEGRDQVGPQGLDGPQIGGSLVVGPGEHDEQWRRVDAAVVLAERHLLERGHLTGARFMEDLTGLSILLLVDCRGLGRREVAEHAPRQVRAHPARHSSAVMRPSRPNGVLNHGKPAYGYGPVGSAVTSMCRSEIARLNQTLNCQFTEVKRHCQA